MRALDLQVVASSRGGGPIVLLAHCFAPEQCPALSTLRLEREWVAGALSGTVEVKAMPGSSAEQLIFFRPAQPVEAIGNSTFIASFANYDSLRISLPLQGTATPFEGLTSRIWERSAPQGEHYSCGQRPRACEPNDWLDWDERLLIRPILDVWMPANDGWLFRSVTGLYPDGPWGLGTVAATDLNPDQESCVALEGWNVVTDAHEMRSVCATGPRSSDAAHSVTTPVPWLGRCPEPPVRGDGERASELFETYCRDRAAFCADQTLRPAVCTIDPGCGVQVPDADGGGLGASMQAAANEEDVPGEPEQADVDGCALGHRAGHSWALALLVIARVWRRKRAG